jgi:hypothetical protein
MTDKSPTTRPVVRLDRAAIFARLDLIAHERGLAPSEFADAKRSENSLVRFAYRHKLSYWKRVKAKNLELERSLDSLDLERLRGMDSQGWYRFLHDEYFVWKYTAASRSGSPYALFFFRVAAALAAAALRLRVAAALRPAARRFRVCAAFWPDVSFFVAAIVASQCEQRFTVAYSKRFLLVCCLSRERSLPNAL